MNRWSAMLVLAATCTVGCSSEKSTSTVSDAGSADVGSADAARTVAECFASSDAGTCLEGCREQEGYVQRAEQDGGLCLAPIRLYCGVRLSAWNTGVACWVRLSDGAVITVPSVVTEFGYGYRECGAGELAQRTSVTRYCEQPQN